MSAPEVRGVTTAAKWLGVDRKTLYEAIGRGDVPHRRIGRRIVLSRQALLMIVLLFDTQQA